MRVQRDNHFMEALYVVFIAFCLLAVSSCARHEKLEERVETQVQAVPPIQPGPQLNRASREILFEAENLTPKQKDQLRALHVKSTREMARLRSEIGRHQLVLTQNLVNPKVPDDQIRIVRQKILDLERQRTERWLTSLDEARRILGRRTEEDQRVYRAFILTEPMTGEELGPVIE